MSQLPIVDVLRMPVDALDRVLIPVDGCRAATAGVDFDVAVGRLDLVDAMRRGQNVPATDNRPGAVVIVILAQRYLVRELLYGGVLPAYYSVHLVIDGSGEGTCKDPYVIIDASMRCLIRSRCNIGE